jgi:hypothetical protein
MHTLTRFSFRFIKSAAKPIITDAEDTFGTFTSSTSGQENLTQRRKEAKVFLSSLCVLAALREVNVPILLGLI